MVIYIYKKKLFAIVIECCLTNSVHHNVVVGSLMLVAMNIQFLCFWYVTVRNYQGYFRIFLFASLPFTTTNHSVIKIQFETSSKMNRPF